MLLITPLDALAMSYGVDVSHHNGAVDFASVRDGGIDFAMIRLGYYNRLDDEFMNNAASVSEAGMEYGVYLYSYAFNDTEAKTEADFVIKTLNSLGDYKKKLTLPIAYDVEDKQLESIGKEQINKNINIFCTAVQKAGYVPMVFSSYYFFNTYIDLDTVCEKGWKIWLSKWESNPDLSTKKEVKSGAYADIWQYKAGNDTQTGLDRYDRNIAYNLSSLKTVTPKIKLSKPVIKKLKSTKKKTLAVKWNKIKNASGYEIQYSTNKKFKKKYTKIKKVSPKKLSLTVKKLKSRKKYYVRVRAYNKTNKKTVYSKWSKVKNVKVK